jgi:proline racemase
VAGPLLAVTTTDYHTAGEPFRIVTGGVPPIPGRTILEKRRWAQEHLEPVRKLLVHEPRGHADMYGCFVTEPEDGGADLGVLFFHNSGYSTACGHGTIALATAAVETGMVPSIEPETSLTLDVPSGRVPVTVTVAGGRATGAAFRNIPAWVEATGL